MRADITKPSVSEAAEPKAGTAPVPVWIFVVLFLLLYWGMVYFDQESGWFSPQVYAPYTSLTQLAEYQPASGGVDLSRGKQVYENVCALCHNNDGAGKPNQAPPLAGSDWVMGPPKRLISIPLVGLAGPVQVKGTTWNLSMPAMGAALSDDDLAAVLSYMRASWGNKADAITADQVKAVRGGLGNRSQPWSADELLKIQ